MEGVGTVVAFGTVEPRQIFHVGTRQTLPGGRKVFFDAQQVDGRASGGGTEGLPGDLAGKGMVLQVKESRGSLDVGKGFRAGHLLPLEHLARAERPFELAHKLFEVVLHHAIERHQIAVDVIEHLDGRRLGPHEIQRGPSGKDFNIAFVRWKQRNKAIGQAAFAAHPRDDRSRHR
ncbi:hypothetical protein D3C71_1220000 [compost metagenome]